MAQDIERRVMNTITFDSVALINKGIHSVHVFAEMISDNYSKTGTYIMSSKKMEAEFNDNGQIVYERTNMKTDNAFVLGEGGTMHVLYTYDDQGRIIKECYSEQRRDYCQECTYDQDGHYTSISNTGDVFGNETRHFVWENGKMIKSYVTGQTDNYNGIQEYDEKGRLIYYAYNSDFKTRLNYIEKEGLVTRETITYRKDTVFNTYKYTYQQGTDNIVYYSRIEGTTDTIEVVKVSYDEHNNIKEVRSENFERARFMREMEMLDEMEEGDLKANRENYQPYVMIYHFDNTYRDGLLAKRHITATHEDGRKDREINRIEWFIYETEPLILHSWTEKEEEYLEEDSFESYPIETEGESIPPVSIKKEE